MSNTDKDVAFTRSTRNKNAFELIGKSTVQSAEILAAGIELATLRAKVSSLERKNARLQRELDQKPLDVGYIGKILIEKLIFSNVPIMMATDEYLKSLLSELLDKIALHDMYQSRYDAMNFLDYLSSHLAINVLFTPTDEEGAIGLFIDTSPEALGIGIGDHDGVFASVKDAMSKFSVEFERIKSEAKRNDDGVAVNEWDEPLLSFEQWLQRDE